MTDKLIKATVKEAGGRGTSIVNKRLQEIDTGVYADVVAIGGVEGDITLTGDLVVDTLGALNNAKVVDPDAVSATLPALTRGQLTQLLTMVTRLTAIATAIGVAGDAAGANTVIGQLKQIAINTTPP